MALALGLENKRNVAIVIVLFAALFGYGGYLIYQTISGPPVPSQSSSTQTEGPNAPVAPGKPAAGSAEAQRLSNAGIDPSLHFDKLAQSEDVRYEGTGRNIFSSESAPDFIPTPLKSARNTPIVPAARARSAQAAGDRPQILRLLSRTRTSRCGLLRAWR